MIKFLKRLYNRWKMNAKTNSDNEESRHAYEVVRVAIHSDSTIFLNIRVFLSPSSV